MAHYDLSHWPLVISVEQGAASLADMQAFIDAWGQWLARAQAEPQAFATLRVLADDASMTPVPGSPPLFKTWLQRDGAAIRQCVAGMAIVVPDSALTRVRKMNMEKLFGVPTAAFAELPDALDWLRKHVYVPKGWTLNAKAVNATVESLLTVRR